MASPTAVDQTRLAPSRDDEGGLLSLVAAIPRLPSNPSNSPGKKLLSRDLSAANPTRMSGATSGCLRGPLCSSWCILPLWSAILKESSPIRVFVSCWDCNSPRWTRMNFSISLWASSSRVRGRAILSWTAVRNCWRAVPTTAFWEGRVVLTWVAASKSLRNLSMAAYMLACHVRKASPKSSPIRILRQRNSTISDFERAWSTSQMKPISCIHWRLRSCTRSMTSVTHTSMSSKDRGGVGGCVGWVMGGSSWIGVKFSPGYHPHAPVLPPPRPWRPRVFP